MEKAFIPVQVCRLMGSFLFSYVNPCFCKPVFIVKMMSCVSYGCAYIMSASFAKPDLRLVLDVVKNVSIGHSQVSALDLSWLSLKQVIENSLLTFFQCTCQSDSNPRAHTSQGAQQTRRYSCIFNVFMSSLLYSTHLYWLYFNHNIILQRFPSHSAYLRKRLQCNAEA